jgi:hypothetical protein
VIKRATKLLGDDNTQTAQCGECALIGAVGLATFRVKLIWTFTLHCLCAPPLQLEGFIVFCRIRHFHFGSSSFELSFAYRKDVF